MIIYLDESGDLGLDFEQKKTSRYLVVGLLVFPDGASGAAHTSMVRAVKRTLKNKLRKQAAELKGIKLPLSSKKYFLKEMNEQENWQLYIAIADKKAWASHHFRNKIKLCRKALYDEVAKRIFFQVDNLESFLSIHIVVDCSKNKKEIEIFNKTITEGLSSRLVEHASLSIKHRNSHEDAGLQAIDLFCSGLSKKYENKDLAWYGEFSERIAVEVEYKF